MNAISLFSGVGGFEIGFQRAGIETVMQAERDPWALAVLARHWPETERVTDVRDVRAAGVGHGAGDSAAEQAASDAGDRANAQSCGSGIDLVYGGFPCQDLSVAGKRAGLGGERSNLWFEFRRVVSELRPRYCVVENVPGLHSSSSGEDFTVVASGLVELGYGVAWRILDAQFFGVAQRRRRVFIVASRDADGRSGAERSAQVLSLCESCGGHPAEGGTPGEDLAFALAASARGTGDGHGNAWNSTYVAPALAASGRGTARVGESRGQDPLVVAHAVTASAGHHGHSSPRGDGSDNLVAPTLDTHLGDKRWLENQNVENYGVMQHARAGVRRLTPRECERLMGWPEAENTVIVDVCQFVPPKTPARAVGQSLSVRWSVGSAGSAHPSAYASSAGTPSSSSNPPQMRPVEVSVAFDCEGGGITIRTEHGRSLSVSSAEASALFAHLGLDGGSALLGALTTSTLLRIIQSGAEGSPQSGPPSQPPASGSVSVALSGREIAERAGDAAPSIAAASACMKSTTSRPGRGSLTAASILRTLLSCVVDATSGFIPELTQSGASFTLSLSLSSGHTRWTADGREIADSHRYRMCGNGVVAPVAEWIGHRLVAVDRLLL